MSPFYTERIASRPAAGLWLYGSAHVYPAPIRVMGRVTCVAQSRGGKHPAVDCKPLWKRPRGNEKRQGGMTDGGQGSFDVELHQLADNQRKKQKKSILWSRLWWAIGPYVRGAWTHARLSQVSVDIEGRIAVRLTSYAADGGVPWTEKSTGCWDENGISCQSGSRALAEMAIAGTNDPT
ncbi:hypothetical protein NM208_g17146 [Fusarium decemcellulare]|uniref:Uncharacterized protein n=1 Tax=Fusarium decemcellulare TaxID=57161 RepID=A0ACC1RBK9_9HYPO|nr:hypothetical protein NM208_g17146 [Fusarium decemcellulare]